MSEHSAEAERVDESAYGDGGLTAREADVASSGSDAADVGPTQDLSEGADESVANSHAADVDAGYDDAGDSLTVGTDAEEDGTL